MSSVENQRCLQRAVGHHFIGEKSCGEQAEVKAALARQGRHHVVAGDLEVKDVMLDAGMMLDRRVVCRNSDEATRDAAVRAALVERPEAAIPGSDHLLRAERDKLACRRLLRVRASGLGERIDGREHPGDEMDQPA